MLIYQPSCYIATSLPELLRFVEEFSQLMLLGYFNLLFLGADLEAAQEMMTNMDRSQAIFSQILARESRGWGVGLPHT